MYPVVRGVFTQLSQPRREDAGAWVVGRPFDDQSLGDSFSGLAGKDIPKAQAAGGRKLADGRDVYQGA